MTFGSWWDSMRGLTKVQQCRECGNGREVPRLDAWHVAHGTVSCFQLGRHIWGVGLALCEDLANKEGERQVSLPCCRIQVLREEEGEKSGHERFARHQSSWELLERRLMACVGRLTS